MGRMERLNQQQQARIKAQFAAGVHNGSGRIRDRFGHVLAPGEAVLFSPAMAQVFQIADLQPVVDPRLPAGLVQVVLIPIEPVLVRAEQPQAELVHLPELTARLLKAAEAASETAATPHADAPTTAAADQPAGDPNPPAEGETPPEAAAGSPAGSGQAPDNFETTPTEEDRKILLTDRFGK